MAHKRPTFGNLRSSPEDHVKRSIDDYLLKTNNKDDKIKAIDELIAYLELRKRWANGDHSSDRHTSNNNNSLTYTNDEISGGLSDWLG